MCILMYSQGADNVFELTTPKVIICQVLLGTGVKFSQKVAPLPQDPTPQRSKLPPKLSDPHLLCKAELFYLVAQPF